MSSIPEEDVQPTGSVARQVFPDAIPSATAHESKAKPAEDIPAASADEEKEEEREATPLASDPVVQEENMTIADLWDGQELKCSFRRTFTDELMTQWFDLVHILRFTRICQDEDSLIWQYETKGVYSTKTMYVVLTFGGVQLGS